MKRHRWILFVESNTSGTGRLFIAAARALGYDPIMLARDSARYPFIVEDGVATRRVDTADPAALAGEADRLAHEQPVAAVLSSSEYFLAAAAQLAQRCGVPGPDPAAIVRARNKAEQRDALRGAGLVVPNVAHVERVVDARAAALALGFPVVLKPIDGTGSIGVRLCRNVGEVVTHATTLLARRHNERHLTTLPGLLVEQYVSGREYSAEVFGDTVVGVTRKHLSRPPFFVEIGHDYPATLPGPMRRALDIVVRGALTALGLGWGPAHIEFRLGPLGPVIIEVNARLAGGFIPELIRAAHNLDLIEQTVRVATCREGGRRGRRGGRRWPGSKNGHSVDPVSP